MILRHSLAAFGGPLLVVFLTTALVHADSVSLSDGSQVLGTVQTMVDGSLKIEDGDVGAISLPFGKVTAMTTEDDHIVWLEDDTRLDGRFTIGADGSPRLLTAEGEVPIDYTAIRSISPPEDKPVTHNGNIDISGKSTEGNSRTKSASANAEYVRRTEGDRFSILADWNYGEDQGETSQKNASARGKYDYFFTDKLFAYGNVSFFGDAFQDLDLRSTVGAGAGYQFVENDTYKFYEEIGVSYFHEDFDVGIENEYASSRFSGRFDWAVTADRVTFFHFHEVFWSLENEQDVLLDSKTGFRFTLISDFYASLQVNYRWDNTPAPGNDRSDTEYLLGLGYSFEF